MFTHLKWLGGSQKDMRVTWFNFIDRLLQSKHSLGASRKPQPDDLTKSTSLLTGRNLKQDQTQMGDPLLAQVKLQYLMIMIFILYIITRKLLLCMICSGILWFACKSLQLFVFQSTWKTNKICHKIMNKKNLKDKTKIWDKAEDVTLTAGVSASKKWHQLMLNYKHNTSIKCKKFQKVTRSLKLKYLIEKIEENQSSI